MVLERNFFLRFVFHTRTSYGNLKNRIINRKYFYYFYLIILIFFNNYCAELPMRIFCCTNCYRWTMGNKPSFDSTVVVWFCFSWVDNCQRIGAYLKAKYISHFSISRGILTTRSAIPLPFISLYSDFRLTRNLK